MEPQGITRAERVLTRRVKSTDTRLPEPGREGSSTNGRQHLPALPFPERAALIPAPPAPTLRLVNLVSPCVSLALFKLLSLH